MKPYFKFFWPGILTLPAGGLFVLGLLTFGPRQASDIFYQRALIGGMLIVLGGFAFWKAIEFANAAHGSHTVRAIFAALTAAALILHGEFYILWPDWKLIQNPLAVSFHGPGKASWNLPSAVLVASNASDIDGTSAAGNQKLSFDTLDESRSCPIILDREGNADRETPLPRSGPYYGSRVSRLDESMRKGGVDRFVRTDEGAPLPASDESANDGGTETGLSIGEKVGRWS